MTVLVCPCGTRVKAPGAVPGRVGRCPSCGGILRVPETGPPPCATEPEATIEEAPPPPPRATATRKKPRRAPPPESFGLVRMPRRIESDFAASLPYPLWDAGGLMLLAVFPPVLMAVSMFSFGLRSYLTSDEEVTRLGALTLAVPMLIILLGVLGYAILFLERVLETTAQGETAHPRWPGWETPAVLGGLVRWIAAALPGLIATAALAALYLGGCPTPRRIGHEVAALAILGTGLALLPLPLAAAVTHGDARAANPLAVLVAARRAGPGLAAIGLLFGLTGAAFLGTVPLLYRLPDPLTTLAAVWLYWLLACHAAMVLIRRLGLFYARSAAALGWFPDRPRWGAN